MSPWQLMLLPFLECLVLVGIHSYLGIHVIKRKVIFVDLALAQIAALGMILALFSGLQPHTVEAYVFSLLFTFIGAAVFSLTRLRDETIPHEAVIGLVYALAAAVSVLAIDRAPHGAEHIKEILTGSILWVKGETIAVSAVVYTLVGAFHFLFRRRFFLISEDPKKAFEQGISVRFWDFLFYITFGVVITLSVHTAGVLLVFVFLVVPAIMAILITNRLAFQLIIGWGVGVVVSVIGLGASYAYDFPSGPMVVTVYGAALLLVAIVQYVVRSKNRTYALFCVAGGIGAVVLIVAMFHTLGNILSTFHTPGDNERHIAHFETKPPVISGDLAYEESRAWVSSDMETMDLVAKQKHLAQIGDPKALVDALESAKDEETRFVLASRLFEIDPLRGKRSLLDLMATSPVPIFRSEALSSLMKLSGSDFGYDPMSEPSEKKNQTALLRWRSWLDEP